MRIVALLGLVIACRGEARVTAPPKTEPPPCTSVAAIELRGKAQLAVGLSAQLTLALPLAWPSDREGVVYFAYPSEALPTGIQRTRLRSPSPRIVFAPVTSAPQLEAIDSSSVLGTQDDPAEPTDATEIARAEQALVDIVSGCRTADQATGEIEAYLRWLEDEPVIAQDLARRSEPFTTWLRTADR